jgi:hypothetical protein
MEVNMQQALTIMGEVKPLESLPSQLITKCKTKLDAIRLMVQFSGLSNDYICSACNIQPAQFTRMMQGRANIPADRRYTRLLNVCGNDAVIQWEALQFGFKLVANTDARISALQEELDQLRATA